MTFSSALLLASAACGSSAPAPTPGKEPARKRLPGPSEKTCDPAGCETYCTAAACGESREVCVTRCSAVCGDGYFDDRDGEVMTLKCDDEADKKAPADGCAEMRKCCDKHYTSQLCADAVDGGDRIEDKPTPEQM